MFLRHITSDSVTLAQPVYTFSVVDQYHIQIVLKHARMSIILHYAIKGLCRCTFKKIILSPVSSLNTPT